jgi:hypothetical protein
LFGSISVLWLVGRSGNWNWPLVAGHGYLFGLFLTTVCIRIWDALGLTLNFWGLAGVILSVGFVSALAQIRQSPAAYRDPAASTEFEPWQLLVIGVLGLLIGYRMFLLIQEIVLRPLYPWDAFMNWAPKAIVWYEYGQLVPYVDPELWLQQSPGDTRQTLLTWKYPETVPLIQLWSMMGAQTSDHTLIYLPWALLLISISLALYGHLRLQGGSTLMAIGAVYLLTSIPYINVHTALAGYADLWQMGALALASYALYEWDRSRQLPYAILCVFFAAVCTQIKIPGIVLGITILILLAISILRLSRRTYIGIGLVGIALLAFILTAGISLDIPRIGHIEFTGNRVEISRLATFNIEYLPTHGAFFESLFVMINWNLTWYLFAVVLLVQVASTKSSRPSMDLLVIFSTLAFVFLVLNFTERAKWALDYTTLNRALLYTIPTVIFYVTRNISNSWIAEGNTHVKAPRIHPSPALTELVDTDQRVQ